MCKIGDIIVIKKYIGDDGKVINKQHSFVVIDDNHDKIEGIEYDLVANVMSSFKDEEHRAKKLRFKENIEITSDDIDSEKNNGKNGYIKADQLYYFEKSNIDYYVLAHIDNELLDELIRIIIELRYENKIKMNIKNLTTRSNKISNDNNKELVETK